MFQSIGEIMINIIIGNSIDRKSNLLFPMDCETSNMMIYNEARRIYARISLYQFDKNQIGKFLFYRKILSFLRGYLIPKQLWRQIYYICHKSYFHEDLSEKEVNSIFINRRTIND